MYHAACKVEFQPFKRSYSQLTFFYNVITTRLLIILYYNIVLTITAVYAGSVYHEGYRSVTVMLGVSHVEVCISARFAGGGGRFHTVVFLIQYILHKDKT